MHGGGKVALEWDLHCFGLVWVEPVAGTRLEHIAGGRKKDLQSMYTYMRYLMNTGSAVANTCDDAQFVCLFVPSPSRESPKGLLTNKQEKPAIYQNHYQL